MRLEMLKISLLGINRRRDESRNNLLIIVVLFPQRRLMNSVEVHFLGSKKKYVQRSLVSPRATESGFEAEG